jgi:glutamyl-tRNA reductase
VEAILEDALAEFNDWSREMLVSPAINRFKNALEQIRQEELARYVKGLSAAEMELMEKITGSLVQRIVKLPVLELKAACRRGDAEDMIESLSSLFNLAVDVPERKR